PLAPHDQKILSTNFRLQALELWRSHSSYTQESVTRHDLALIVGERVRSVLTMERFEEESPRLKARITGVFYLLTILTGIFAQGFVSGRLVVDGDAAATATNILTHKTLFQWGFTVYLIEMACQIAVTALFYDLLKPPGRSISLLAAFLGLAGCVIKTFSRVFYIAPLFVLGGAHYLSVFSPEQL